jgi:hypothetical protein
VSSIAAQAAGVGFDFGPFRRTDRGRALLRPMIPLFGMAIPLFVFAPV